MPYVSPSLTADQWRTIAKEVDRIDAEKWEAQWQAYQDDQPSLLGPEATERAKPYTYYPSVEVRSASIVQIDPFTGKEIEFDALPDF